MQKRIGKNQISLRVPLCFTNRFQFQGSSRTFTSTFSIPFLALYGIGAGVGVRLAPRIHADHIKRIFGVVLIIIALVMIQQKVLGV